MTKEEFLLDTIEYYAEDTTRRAVQSGFCRLKTIDGRKCALGRFIPDEVYNINEYIEQASVLDLKDTKALSDEIIDLDTYFLKKVQGLHDKSEYWEKERGLTWDGRSQLEQIIKGFYLDKTQFEKYLND